MDDALCLPDVSRDAGKGYVGARCGDGGACGGRDEFGVHYAVYQVMRYTEGPDPPISPAALAGGDEGGSGSGDGGRGGGEVESSEGGGSGGGGGGGVVSSEGSGSGGGGGGGGGSGSDVTPTG
ncbi:hypothetical protein BC829DRAFT_491432, partial [Chytridium lagenaria]